MKNLLIYILGIFTGLVIIFFIGLNGSNKTAIDNPYNLKGLVMLEDEGECITNKSLKVFQTINTNKALVEPITNGNINNNDLFLLVNNNNKIYYDGEIIKIPSKKCAKQIGVFSYETKSEDWKTVPVVIIK